MAHLSDAALVNHGGAAFALPSRTLAVTSAPIVHSEGLPLRCNFRPAGDTACTQGTTGWWQINIALSMCLGFVLGVRRRSAPAARGSTLARQALPPAGLSATLSQPLPELPALSQADKQRLRHGLAVQKQERRGGGGWGLVVMDVNAPSSTVLGVLQAFESYKDVIPTVREVSLLSREKVRDGIAHVRCTYRISRFRLKVSAVHVVDLARRIVRFDLDPTASGGLMRDASGSWYVESSPDDPSKSRIWFRCCLHAAEWVPQWLVDYGAKRALRRATSWVKPHVERLQYRAGATRRSPPVSPAVTPPAHGLRLRPAV